MGSGILPVAVLGCATSTGKRLPEVSKRSQNWWGLVLGWSTEPDYIETGEKVNMGSGRVRSGSGSDLKLTAKTRPAFTEEKARQLRKMMTETTAFHDAMYHSSIAAKLASHFENASSDR